MKKTFSMAAIVVAVGMTVQIFGCSAETETHTAADPATAHAAPPPPPEVDHPLKPEMVIVFTKGTLACLTKDDLHEIMDHGARNEATKMQAMMAENGGNCLMVPPTKRVKIISVEYNNPEM